MLGATLTTTAAPRATSASALTRSMSTWSMTAISPGWSRLVRFLVRRSTRTVRGTGAPGTPARPVRRVASLIALPLPRAAISPPRSAGAHRRAAGTSAHGPIRAWHRVSPPRTATELRLFRNGTHPGCPRMRGRRIRRRSGRLGPHRLPQQLLGVALRQAALGVPGQHARQLPDPTPVVEPLDAAGRDPAVVGLLHGEVPVREGRHLRQVGHADHLAGTGEQR